VLLVGIGRRSSSVANLAIMLLHCKQVIGSAAGAVLVGGLVMMLCYSFKG